MGDSMNNLSWYPKVVCYAERCEASMIFFGPHDQIEVKGHAAMQQELLRLCTGHYTAGEIINFLSSSYHDEQVMQLLAKFFEQGIVVDSRNCWQGYHAFSSNPMPFFSPPSDEMLRGLYCTQAYRQKMECEKSDFLELLCHRESTRDFTNRPISRDAILRIACAGYGITSEVEVMGVSIGRRTVPSAGALYPLSVHVVVRRSSNDEHGIYAFDGIRLNEITKSFEDETWQKCFLDDVYVRTHSACFVVSGNIERQTIKYADRGYRYTILEAGHVAQNMILACAEMDGIGCVEIGGFIDAAIAQFLSLPNSLVPITTILVGPVS